MATSGSYTFSLTLNELAEQAFHALQIGSEGESMTGDFYNQAKKSLNLMIKAWEGQGIHLWTFKEGTLFLNVGQYVYNFGDAHLANDYRQTTATAAASIGASTVSVAATTGLANGDPIGFIDGNNNLSWYTVQSFVADTSVTLTAPLTVDLAANTYVYHYTLNSFVPVQRVLAVRRRELNDYEVPINFISRDEFMSLPNKDSQGDPIQAYYSRELPYGVMYIWNSPVSAVPVIRFTYERKLQIMDDPTNTFDLPEEWYEALVYNLAKRLIPIYGCSDSRKADIYSLAKETLDTALGFDTTLYPIKVTLQRY